MSSSESQLIHLSVSTYHFLEGWLLCWCLEDDHVLITYCSSCYIGKMTWIPSGYMWFYRDWFIAVLTRSSKKHAGYLMGNNVLKSLQKLITLVESIFCVCMWSSLDVLSLEEWLGYIMGELWKDRDGNTVMKIHHIMRTTVTTIRNNAWTLCKNMNQRTLVLCPWCLCQECYYSMAWNCFDCDATGFAFKPMFHHPNPLWDCMNTPDQPEQMLQCFHAGTWKHCSNSAKVIPSPWPKPWALKGVVEVVQVDGVQQQR